MSCAKGITCFIELGTEEEEVSGIEGNYSKQERERLLPFFQKKEQIACRIDRVFNRSRIEQTEDRQTENRKNEIECSRRAIWDKDEVENLAFLLFFFL